MAADADALVERLARGASAQLAIVPVLRLHLMYGLRADVTGLSSGPAWRHFALTDPGVLSFRPLRRQSDQLRDAANCVEVLISRRPLGSPHSNAARYWVRRRDYSRAHRGRLPNNTRLPRSQEKPEALTVLGLLHSKHIATPHVFSIGAHSSAEADSEVRLDAKDCGNRTLLARHQ